jgi:hypothetical protein
VTDPVKAFMQANALVAPAFAPGSRYHGLDTAQWTRPDGAEVTYVRRRIVPPAENFVSMSRHRVAEGDRVDNLADRYFGDPEQYWRLCDANGTIQPKELTRTIGRVLRITLADGVPGGLDV